MVVTGGPKLVWWMMADKLSSILFSSSSLMTFAATAGLKLSLLPRSLFPSQGVTGHMWREHESLNDTGSTLRTITSGYRSKRAANVQRHAKQMWETCRRGWNNTLHIDTWSCGEKNWKRTLADHVPSSMLSSCSRGGKGQMGKKSCFVRAVDQTVRQQEVPKPRDGISWDKTLTSVHIHYYKGRVHLNINRQNYCYLSDQAEVK